MMPTRWPDGEPVVIETAAMKPEDVTNPTPRCVRMQYIKKHPADAVKQTWTGLFDAIGEMCRLHDTWRALSLCARRALEATYLSQPIRMHPSTRGCLTRRDLIGPSGAVTLSGRQVVDEAQRMNIPFRERECGCCFESRPDVWGRIEYSRRLDEHHRPQTCACDCHRPCLAALEVADQADRAGRSAVDYLESPDTLTDPGEGPDSDAEAGQ